MHALEGVQDRVVPLHFPHLHGTQINTNPDVHGTHIYTAQIYTNPFSHIDSKKTKFAQPKFTQKSILLRFSYNFLQILLRFSHNFRQFLSDPGIPVP